MSPRARATAKSLTADILIPEKLYFRIGEVSRLCQLPAYVLRFWETEFPQLKPVKSSTGQRMYRRKASKAFSESRGSSTRKASPFRVRVNTCDLRLRPTRNKARCLSPLGRHPTSNMFARVCATSSACCRRVTRQGSSGTID